MPEPIQSQVRQVHDFRATLTPESDRGCALMAAAYLDDHLKILFDHILVDDRKYRKRVLDMNGALGTFSARIDMAYLLGMIPKNAQSDLHRLRNIRNQFAHVAGPITFEDPTIASLCGQLMFGVSHVGIGMRGRFTRSMMGLLWVIIMKRVRTVRYERATDVDLTGSRVAREQVERIWADLGWGELPK
ncbi:Mannitol repressor [Caballeronia arationis]|uniref:Mannitol repressor n=1 Tax=Caballeronia arationis TaxID=1777142 RepID=A0A7Z7ICD3_9BURK|nr:Mannitol repressor [Caballeronia arationis]